MPRGLSMASPHPFGDWLGREERARDMVTERLVAGFAATLAPHLASTPEGVAPPLLHWCLAPVARPQAELGEDGHPALGGFLPPVPLPRRMWASGEVAFHDNLRIGDEVTRVSRIASIERKAGRTGELWFVDVDHEIATARGPALHERQTIVYRGVGARPASAPQPSIAPGPGDASIAMTTTRLFRYSALTFNGHRIHYDYLHATNVEGYAGLVVHAPMQATLLAHRAMIVTGRRLARLRFRGLSPLIGGSEANALAVRDGESVHCCFVDAAGGMTMEAFADLA